jgi:hypothetical protein
MSELGYVLHVDGQRVQQIFQEFEEAKDAARSYMNTKKMAALRIQSTTDVLVKTWDYDYGLSTWVRHYY